MTKDKDFCRKQFVKKLKAFAKASAELDSMWEILNSSDDDDAFFAPCENYPFPYSFDEMDSKIFCWVEQTVEKLNNMMEDSK